MVEFTMVFEPTTIKHLGLHLYTTLPPVISELIANAWDADAKTVNISIPVGEINESYEVTIEDNGKGMNEDEIQNAYLKISRNQRVELKRDETPGRRKLMGRKGIGKLAPFGVASEVEVRTWRDGKEICINLNYKDIENCTPPYRPKVLEERKIKDGLSGTKITIRKFYRKKSIDSELIRKQIARRFSVISNDFAVYINNVQIKPEDRRLANNCVKYWSALDLPKKGIVDEQAGWEVTGWMGFVDKSSQIDRGIDIFARGKIIETDSMFGLGTTNTQFARSYLVGEVHADFLDKENDDISTGRNSVLWETDEGQKLEGWGQLALQFVMEKWLEYRHEAKKEKINTPDFKRWLATRTKSEQRVASKLLDVIVKNDDIDPESAKPLLDIIKSNIEFQAFQELADSIEENGLNIQGLLSLLGEWRIFEARELLRLSDGHLDILNQLMLGSFKFYYLQAPACIIAQNIHPTI